MNEELKKEIKYSDIQMFIDKHRKHKEPTKYEWGFDYLSIFDVYELLNKILGLQLK